MAERSYTAISDTEIDADSPITASLMSRLRDNPIAGLQGIPAAITDEAAVAVDWTPTGGGLRNALKTDETDTSKVLTPDGSNSTQWSSISGLGKSAALFTGIPGQVLGTGQGVQWNTNVGSANLSNIVLNPLSFDLDNSGLYVLLFNGSITTSYGNSTIYFRKNGTTIQYTTAYLPSPGTHTFAEQGLFSASAGDTIDCVCASSLTTTLGPCTVAVIKAN